ncbi:MAG TPA: tautomerase family protein [Allosphingosinicella sp.]|jgi:4-oxalocrotonate tautomerase|nr:tautomerase family protein [Allosphingosinicella sp.]
MAIIDVTLHEGRPRDVKERIMMRLTQVLIEEIGAQPHQVRVVLREVKRENYAVGGKPV